jgi:hypothetical protein
MIELIKKINGIRIDLQNSKLKKSGRNEYTKFEYFELSDFLPKINDMCNERGVITLFRATKEIAALEITDGKDKVIFEVPFSIPEMKGSNETQKIGGAITYYRRYLFLIAFEIVESDTFDKQHGQAEKHEEIGNRPDTDYIMLVSQYKDLLSKIKVLPEDISKVDFTNNMIKEKNADKKQVKTVLQQAITSLSKKYVSNPEINIGTVKNVKEIYDGFEVQNDKEIPF